MVRGRDEEVLHSVNMLKLIAGGHDPTEVHLLSGSLRFNSILV